MDDLVRTPHGMVRFVLSDTHFSHRNICEYEPIRKTLGADHNTVMIRRWQETVGDDDLVLHLGDLALGGRTQFEAICDRLPGRKVIILGNHDRRSKRWYREVGFEPVKPFEIDYRGWKVRFQHYPDDEHQFICYPKHLLVHGHVHSKTRRDRRMINLSVEAIDFRPLPLAWVLDERIAELTGR